MTRAFIATEFDALPHEVFRGVADQQRFFRGPGIEYCHVTRDGQSERDGLGSIRDVKASGMRFVEEITAFVPHEQIDYLVVECDLPMIHEGGSIRFRPSARGTSLTWESTFTLKIPLVGGLLARMLRIGLERHVRSMLEQLRRDLREERDRTNSAS